jgi:hypothetical protein
LATLAFFALLGAFLAGVAFFPALPLVGATWRAGFATLAFLLAFGCSSAAGPGVVALAYMIVFILVSP